MMQLRKLGTLAGAAALFLGSGCVDLDVTNPNNPDIARALASPEDVKALAASSVNDWYINSTYYEPYLAMMVTSDNATANFGNFGMRFNNLEPRKAYENNSAGGDREVTRRPWDWNYGTLGSANDALRAFATGIALPTAAETEAYVAVARFSQAASMMNLALMFDRSFVVDETTTEIPELADYKAMTDAAMAAWDKGIAGTAGKTYELPQSVLPMGGTVTSLAVLNRVMNTMAAITLAYTPRNAAEAAAAPWARILGYAENGITQDFSVVGDGGNSWYSYIVAYGNLESWIRTDMRLINRMDPTLPSKYTASPGDVAPSTSAAADDRIHSDFANTGGVIGDPGRGIFMQSAWFHTRYLPYAFDEADELVGPVPYILKTENDLLIAEALVRTNGDLGRAASLINNTRVTRGGLAAVSAGSGGPALLAAIDYERDVELMITNGMDHFRARHWEGADGMDRLQDGTWLHLPIPAKELETLGLPIYTFGGVGLPAMMVLPTASGDMLIRAPQKRTGAQRPVSIEY